MASNRAQILISAVDQTRTAFDSIKRGLGGLTDTAKSVNGVLANLGVAVYSGRPDRNGEIGHQHW